MKNKLNLLLICLAIAGASLLSSCVGPEGPQGPSGTNGANCTNGSTNVQIKTFYNTSLAATETEANTWLSTDPTREIISISFTTTPEPSQYYPANSYPGFKYSMVIAYKTK